MKQLIRDRFEAWTYALIRERTVPLVCLAPKVDRETGDPSLVILHATDLERHQVIAVLRQAVRELGGPFAG